MQRSRQVALAARTPQRIRAAFEKLNSQAAKDGAPGSAVPGNSHGAGAPSRGNPGAGEGRKRNILGAPGPRSAHPSQRHFSFFCLIVTQRAWVAEAKPDGRGQGRGTSSKQPRCSLRLPWTPGAPFDSPPPLRPTRSGAASLGEAAARRPPGAGSSLARFGDPEHPQWPPLPVPCPERAEQALPAP